MDVNVQQQPLPTDVSKVMGCVWTSAVWASFQNYKFLLQASLPDF